MMNVDDTDVFCCRLQVDTPTVCCLRLCCLQLPFPVPPIPPHTHPSSVLSSRPNNAQLQYSSTMHQHCPPPPHPPTYLHPAYLCPLYMISCCPPLADVIRPMRPTQWHGLPYNPSGPRLSCLLPPAPTPLQPPGPRSQYLPPTQLRMQPTAPLLPSSCPIDAAVKVSQQRFQLL